MFMRTGDLPGLGSQAGRGLCGRVRQLKAGQVSTHHT